GDKSAAEGGGRAAKEGKQDIEADDSRGANRQAQGTAARLAVQRLYELCGAGFDDHPARREVPPRTVAECEWRDNDSAAAGGHLRPFFPRTPPFPSSSISSGASHGGAAAGTAGSIRHHYLQAPACPPAD